jgi:hypothetical protein
VSPEDIRFHEAGHACAALVLALPVQRISVQPDDTTLGRVDVVYDPSDPAIAVKRMLVILAGCIESRCRGSRLT